jgi:hypothetical protein
MVVIHMRKGMMLGKGRGYKNIIGRDPFVHSQSGKGIKQPQRMPYFAVNPALAKYSNAKLQEGAVKEHIEHPKFSMTQSRQIAKDHLTENPRAYGKLRAKDFNSLSEIEQKRILKKAEKDIEKILKNLKSVSKGGKMSKKDYEAFAKIFGTSKDKDELKGRIFEFMAQDNPKFDRGRFYKAEKKWQESADK